MCVRAVQVIDYFIKVEHFFQKIFPIIHMSYPGVCIEPP